MRTNKGSCVVVVLGLCFSACGTASTQSAEAPASSPRRFAETTVSKPKSSEAQATNATVADPASEQTAEKAEGSAEPAPTSDSEKGDGLRKASRPPAELITGGNVVYVFNFKNSEAGTAAQEHCQQDNTADPAALRACVEAARSKVPVESIRFVKTPAGEYWWITYNRYKGNLLKWNRIQFQPGKATESSIALNLIGKDKGIAPMPRVPRALSIDLPNDYSIVVHHPDHGAMVYDAKIGTMEPDDS